jgi:hypothetical protein
MASSTETNSVAGITLGFVFGLAAVFGLEMVVGYLENLPPSLFEPLATEETQHGSGSYNPIAVAGESGFTLRYYHVRYKYHTIDLISKKIGVELSSGSPRKRTFTYPEGASPADFLEEGDADMLHEESHEWEDEPVDRASLAIAAPQHRDHIKEHLSELLTVVKSMEDKSNELLEVRFCGQWCFTV